MSTPQPRILCVDDEPRILDGLSLSLEWDYRVETTTDGNEALKMLVQAQKEEDPFTVIISDMRMPIMDGATLLKKSRECAPDTTRLLLTGYSDIESAIRAINEGSIFRFLSKPCEEPVLLAAVKDAHRQNQLINSERDLLEKTLKGAAKALSSTLSLTSPLVFSRSAMIVNYVNHILKNMDVEDQWMYELAAMFVFIGFVSVPNDTAHRYITGRTLSEDEKKMIQQCPKIAADLLKEIPRLDKVSDMIVHHIKPQNTPSEKPAVRLGAEMLQASLSFDKYILSGLTSKEAAAEAGFDNPNSKHKLASLLQDYDTSQSRKSHALHVHELCEMMIVDEDVLTLKGQLVLPKGENLTMLTIRRIINFDNNIGIKQPIMIRID